MKKKWINKQILENIPIVITILFHTIGQSVSIWIKHTFKYIQYQSTSQILKWMCESESASKSLGGWGWMKEKWNCLHNYILNSYPRRIVQQQSQHPHQHSAHDHRHSWSAAAYTYTDSNTWNHKIISSSPRNAG